MSRREAACHASPFPVRTGITLFRKRPGCHAGLMDVRWIHRRRRQKGEVLRWKQERADETRKVEQLSLLKLASILAEGSQAVARLSGAADSVKSVAAVEAAAQEYDAQMGRILSELSSAQAASGLSKAASSKIDPLIQRLNTLHTKLHKASVELGSAPGESLHKLKRCVRRANRLTQDVDIYTRSQLRGDREGAASGPDSPAYKEFWDRLVFEHSLLNNRITWLFSSQTVLFAAYGFSVSGTAKVAKNFQTVVAWSGIIVAILMLIGILASVHAKRAVWHDYQRDYNPHQKWGVRTGATWVGLVPDVSSPVVFALAWMFVLIL
jgi:hypothetical protein